MESGFRGGCVWALCGQGKQSKVDAMIEMKGIEVEI